MGFRKYVKQTEDKREYMHSIKSTIQDIHLKHIV